MRRFYADYHHQEIDSQGQLLPAKESSWLGRTLRKAGDFFTWRASVRPDTVPSEADFKGKKDDEVFTGALKPLQLTVAQVARELGVSRKTLSKIVNGHAAITPGLALKLSRAFDTSPELWLNLQQAYSLWEMAHRSPGWRKIHAFKTEIAAAP